VTGFPLNLIDAVRCTVDGGELRLDAVDQEAPGQAVACGSLTCFECGARYRIENGILNLLAAEAPSHPESVMEQRIRDATAATIDASGPVWWDDESNALEMEATFSELHLSPGLRILELGCGDGRYTAELSRSCRSLLATDFSLESLRVLQRRLRPEAPVGLVHGDVTTLQVAAESVDRVFSTLMSNLPTPRHRRAVHLLASRAVTSSGRFVFSVHHHGAWQWLKRETREGHYQPGHIYRSNFTVQQCRRELEPYFEKVKARPIQLVIPLAGRLGLPLRTISPFCERIWPINLFGMLVLCSAEKPRLQSVGVNA
jgi:SAM-dependent methyltransferase